MLAQSLPQISKKNHHKKNFHQFYQEIHSKMKIGEIIRKYVKN
jgi:hypothetical protein